MCSTPARPRSGYFTRHSRRGGAFGEVDAVHCNEFGGVARAPMQVQLLRGEDHEQVPVAALEIPDQALLPIPAHSRSAKEASMIVQLGVTGMDEGGHAGSGEQEPVQATGRLVRRSHRMGPRSAAAGLEAPAVHRMRCRDPIHSGHPSIRSGEGGALSRRLDPQCAQVTMRDPRQPWRVQPQLCFLLRWILPTVREAEDAGDRAPVHAAPARRRGNLPSVEGYRHVLGPAVCQDFAVVVVAIRQTGARHSADRNGRACSVLNPDGCGLGAGDGQQAAESGADGFFMKNGWRGRSCRRVGCVKSQGTKPMAPSALQ